MFLGFRSCWVHQGQTYSRLCPHSDVHCDSRLQVALSGVYLTAIWCDSSNQRVWFAQWFSFKPASPSLPKTLFTCLGGLWVVVIDCWPPFQFHFLCLRTQLTLTPNHSLSLAVCQLHHLVSSWITNGKPNLSASISRRILAACLTNPAEHTAGNLSFLCGVTFWIFLISFFSVSQQLCGV